MALPVVVAAAARVHTAVPDLQVWTTSLPTRVEGSGAVWVEIAHGAPWGPSLSNQRHSSVVVRIYADRTRNDANLPVADDADRRAYAVWEDIDAVLHDVDHTWPEVHSSRRADGPTLMLIPETDRAVLLTCDYEIAHA
jgi:hypothetical protein